MVKKQRVLFISDTHIGAAHTNFEAYRKSLLKEMEASNHVVLAGDILELFYLNNPKHTNRKQLIEGHVDEHTAFLEKFLEEHPHIQLHYVLGNHENIKRFRNNLDEIMAKHSNFEWHPEAIRIGDALVVHGDLQMSENTNKTRPVYRLRDAQSQLKWASILRRLDKPGHAVFEALRAKEIAVPIVHKELYKKSRRGEMHCRHQREEQDFHMDWVRHVFFGHTHVKFNNYEHDWVLYHNMGAFTEVCTQHGRDPGLLEATLDNGTISDVSEVFLRPEPMRGQVRTR